jgi:hypothetical protein
MRRDGCQLHEFAGIVSAGRLESLTANRPNLDCRGPVGQTRCDYD